MPNQYVHMRVPANPPGRLFHAERRLHRRVVRAGIGEFTGPLEFGISRICRAR